MTPISVLTLNHGREAHLARLVEGLALSRELPAELVIAEMGGVRHDFPAAGFPVKTVDLRTLALTLARARNEAARASTGAHLLFLDVDCIPSGNLVGAMREALDVQDALICTEVLYLGPRDAAPGWHEEQLQARGRRHPARDFPEDGIRVETNPGLFWSLAFGIRRDSFQSLGGFDETFVGYGAEDTDFGFRAAARGLPLLFMGGARAFHQYHSEYDPPLQHFADIVRNATIFRERWGVLPMRGWLDAFAAQGFLAIEGDALHVLGSPSEDDVKAALRR